MAALVSRISDLAGAVRNKFNAIMPRLLPPAGEAGRVLVKNSASDHDVKWESASNAVLSDTDARIPTFSEILRISDPLLEINMLPAPKIVKGTGPLSFSRATTGTYIGTDGVFKTAAVNEARIEKTGLLIEGQSTNLLLQSNEFVTGWGQLSTSVTAGVPFIDGTNSACKLVEDVQASLHHKYQSLTYAEGYYSVSLFVQAVERTKCYLLCWTGSKYFFVKFDLTNGTITPPTDFPSGTLDTAYFTSTNSRVDTFPNSTWRRISMSLKVLQGTALCFYVGVCDAAGNVSYAGDGVSGINISRMQVEALPLPSSYIPTTTTTATRQPDICSLPSSGNVPALNTGEMTIVSVYDRIGYMHAIAHQNIMSLYPANHVILRASASFSSNQRSFYYGAAASTLAAQSQLSRGIAAGVFDKTKANVYKDKTKGSDYTGTVSSPETLSRIDIGSWLSSGYLFGHISKLLIYNRALTLREIALLNNSEFPIETMELSLRP